MTYLARTALLRLLRIILIPLLLLSFTGVHAQHFQSSSEEHTRYEIVRLEHKMMHPARTHSLPQKILTLSRLSPPGIIPVPPAKAFAVVLSVSLYPIIYLILKRRRLSPLKYTSQYV
ncbi:hypothetical protein [Paenibacillus sp. HW567]|uniref:hypothetical protein n=1 Tax=Paenibacillus sp. HW567 TaxID=1034769 RepID=UPI00037D060F|nr:hypothetical protein [Paenibacillus sp. HW567]